MIEDGTSVAVVVSGLQDASAASRSDSVGATRRGPDMKAIPIVALLPALIPFFILLVTSLQSLDFGYHWDEDNLVQRVQYTVHKGILVPVGFYNYPGMSYLISVAAAVPDVCYTIAYADSRLSKSSLKTVRADLTRRIEGKAFHMRARGLFAFVTSLGVLWTYLLVLTWRRSWSLALLAASVLGLSWQIAYHARWMAPDDVLMQFAALAMLCVLQMHLRSNKQLWLTLSAIAAGLCFGTKYPGLLLLLPVLISVRQIWSSSIERAQRNRLFGRTVGVCLLTYILTTPGTLLEPTHFVRSVFYEFRHYNRGHYGHTISPGPIHIYRELLFLAMSLFSRYAGIALTFFGLALLGACTLIRKDRSLARVFGSFPVTYLLCMGAQHVFIVRNLLVVAPFLAVLVALGVEAIWNQTTAIALRVGLTTILCTLLLFNAAWLVTASESIRHRSPAQPVRDFVVYARSHSDTRFLVSPQLNHDIAVSGQVLPANVTTDPAQSSDQVALYPAEGMDYRLWPCLYRDMIVTQFGPYEVDFNYYGTWLGEPRILLLTLPEARRIGVKVVR